MAGSGGKATFSAAAASDAARGTGGKLKRQTARRHTTTTPYSRPPQNQVQRSRPWISRIVDPAYRAISSGATKLLPYFFSSAPESEEQQHQGSYIRLLFLGRFLIDYVKLTWFTSIQGFVEFVSIARKLESVIITRIDGWVKALTVCVLVLVTSSLCEVC